MGFFNSVRIAATGLTAQRLRMDTIAENISNAQTTRTADGGPYRRKTVLFEEMADRHPFGLLVSRELNRQGSGVRVRGVVEDFTPGPLMFDPTHPDANEEGYVAMPNINIVEEMVNMISASRSYEANITAMTNLRHITQRTLEIGSGR